MTFQQLMLVLRARWVLALSVFVAVFLLGVVAILISPIQYSASSSVVIDTNPDPTLAAGTGASDSALASSVLTEVDIIGSERIARRVVEITKLSEEPRIQKRWRSATHGQGDIVIWTAEYLRLKKLTVTPTHSSNVVRIAVEWYDRDVAAALANAFAQAAIETNIDLKVEPAKLYSGWFNERIRVLRANLEAAQKRLSNFQNTVGIIATDEKLDVENSRLSELSTQLDAVQGERQASQNHKRQASGDNQSLPEVLQSPVIQALKQNLSIAESKEPDIAARLGKNHPDYQAVEAEIATLRDKISQETTKIATSLGETAQIDVRREADVRAAVEAQKSRVLLLKHQHDESAVLQDDVAAAQRDLDAVSQKFSQTTLESITQLTNVVQLTSAAAPDAPSSPKVLLIMALAIFFGGVAGVGAAALQELRDTRVRAIGELTRLLGVPLLATIGYIPVEAKRLMRRNRLLGRLEYASR
jgi:chain length determinant protein EpsF